MNERQSTQLDLTMTESLHPDILLTRIAYIALWAYFFTVPFEYSIVLREPLESYARVTGVLALLVGTAAVIITGRARRWMAFHWLVLLYLLLVSISLLWDKAPSEEAEHALREYLQVVPVVVLSWEFTRSVKQRTQLIFGYLMGGILSALLVMREAFVLHKAIYAAFRYTVAGWNPNDLAIVFALGLPLALYLALDQSLHASRVQVWTAWLYLPLASIAILLTGSRSGLVDGVVALGAIPFLLSRSSRTRIYTLLAIFASLLCVVLTLIPAGTWHILSTVGEQMQSGDLDKRVKVWRFGWQAFLESPLFGSGVGSFRWASGTLYNAHNTYLEVSVEQGVAGLFLILGLIVISFARLKRATGPGRVAGIFLLLTWVVAATVGHLAESRVTWVVFSLAFLLACDQTSRDVEPSQLADQ
jgi:O-antigen ligase